MSPPAAKKPPVRLRLSDLRGAAKLAADATTGISRVAEGLHRSVLDSMGLPVARTPGRTRGVTGLVYGSVRGVTNLVASGLDGVLAALQPLLDAPGHAGPEAPEREALLAALNGVMGDRLAASNNPLATAMTLRYQGQVVNSRTAPGSKQAGGKLLLLIHGLCMNDLQWRTVHEGQVHDHGAALAAALGYCPLYLRYNSGLHISQNGQELSLQLEQLLKHWPVPMEELSLLGYSMGGLLARSAIHHARRADLAWVKRLKNLVFLGTPHHGAPLERAGSWLDLTLSRTPFSAPFAKLGQLRSAGITDLRYGNLLDEDWQGQDRFERKIDARQALPLPEAVACYAIGGTLAKQRSVLADRLVGDGLVPLNSALGQHQDSQRRLVFARDSRWIAYRTDHLALLRSPAVQQKLQQWLSPG